MAVYRRSIEIRVPPERVFAFHMDARNIARLALPESRTDVLSVSDIPLQVGTRVVVRSVQMGMSVTMEAEIVALEADQMFEDRQVRGPFQRWRHQHLFEPIEGGTRLTDEVEFEVPGGRAGRIMAERLVLSQLEKAFAHRQQETKRLLESEKHKVFSGSS
jgi:ligand-binding SRPBCC domain-containing protein